MTAHEPDRGCRGIFLGLVASALVWSVLLAAVIARVVR